MSPIAPAPAQPATDADPVEVVAAVAAWRARHGAPVDPVRWQVIEALARRAAAQQGLVRQVLQERVADLLGALQAPAHAPSIDHRSTQAPADRGDPPTALADLSALVDRLGRVSARAGRVPAPGAPSAPAATLPDTSVLGSLKSVTAHKDTWSRLRAEQRLRQALDQVPAQAGPLNSSQVVNRALHELQRLSPAYLDAFLSHVDVLMWLEQASGAGELHARAGARAPAVRRAGPRASRKA